MKRIVNFIKTITLLIIMYAYAYFLVVKLCYNSKYKKVRMPKILIKSIVTKRLVEKHLVEK